MQPESDEPILTYTPSNTGRRAKVGYLGIEGVGFSDLWPVFLGAAGSLGLGLGFFVGGDGASHWLPRTLEAALPLAIGFGYLRLLVAGRPPHFKGDLLSALVGVRLNFEDPPVHALPLVPRLCGSAAASGPGRAADLVHPLRTSAEGRVR